MRKRISTSTVAALALFTFVGLVAALAIAWPNLARAHSPGGASLTALTVTSDADGADAHAHVRQRGALLHDPRGRYRDPDHH